MFSGGLSAFQQTMMFGLLWVLVSMLDCEGRGGPPCPHVLSEAPILEGLTQAPPLCEASSAAQRSLATQHPCSPVPPQRVPELWQRLEPQALPHTAPGFIWHHQHRVCPMTETQQTLQTHARKDLRDQVAQWVPSILFLKSEEGTLFFQIL